MRIFVVSLLLLVFLVGGLFLYTGYLYRESDVMLSSIDALARAAESEDWDKTDAAMEETDRLIEEKTPRLALFTDHSILDDIMLTTSAAKGYVKYRETPELMAEIETLRALIAHIPKREKLSLYNIF